MDSLLDAFDVANLSDAELLKVASSKCQQFLTSDIMRDKVTCVFAKLQIFQPDADFLDTPEGHLVAHRTLT